MLNVQLKIFCHAALIFLEVVYLFEPNLIYGVKKREKKSRSDSINHIIIKIKNGDIELKEKFIKSINRIY